MMSKYEKKILNKLLDKYEKSKTFIGDNKVNQKFSIKVAALFPKYIDHSEYEEFKKVNEAIDILNRKNYIQANINSANLCSEISLNIDEVDNAYNYINRKPKKDTNQAILKLMEGYKNKNNILKNYCENQIERLALNKPVQQFNDDIEELEKILIAVEEILKVEEETFIRDFSVRVFKDSKIFEKISTKVINLIFDYGDFVNKESILEELNLIKNPTYVNFKGNGILNIKGQMIDLSLLNGDIAISSSILDDIDEIKVNGKCVITIENLTSFNTYKDKEMLCIYLGGFHNKIRRKFIKKLYKQNQKVKYYHFGDIDAGGFYILEHLRNETDIDFEPYKMDVDTLMKNIDYTKNLSKNDRDRLEKLLYKRRYTDVIEYMLENNCKLEQEAVYL